MYIYDGYAAGAVTRNCYDTQQNMTENNKQTLVFESQMAKRPDPRRPEQGEEKEEGAPSPTMNIID